LFQPPEWAPGESVEKGNLFLKKKGPLEIFPTPGGFHPGGLKKRPGPNFPISDSWLRESWGVQMDLSKRRISKKKFREMDQVKFPQFPDFAPGKSWWKMEKLFFEKKRDLLKSVQPPGALNPGVRMTVNLGHSDFAPESSKVKHFKDSKWKFWVKYQERFLKPLKGWE